MKRGNYIFNVFLQNSMAFNAFPAGHLFLIFPSMTCLVCFDADGKRRARTTLLFKKSSSPYSDGEEG